MVTFLFLSIIALCTLLDASTVAGSGFHIFINHKTFESAFAIDVSSDAMIGNIRMAIKDLIPCQQGMPFPLFTISNAGIVLDDDSPLSECGISAECTIQIESVVVSAPIVVYSMIRIFRKAGFKNPKEWAWDLLSKAITVLNEQKSAALFRLPLAFSIGINRNAVGRYELKQSPRKTVFVNPESGNSSFIDNVSFCYHILFDMTIQGMRSRGEMVETVYV